MARVEKREAAKRDLVELWVWYAENGGLELADRFLAAVEATLEALLKNPRMGVAAPYSSPELAAMRRFPVGGGFEKILLFYLVGDDGIDLVRAIHGSRDLPKLFLDDRNE